MQGMGAAEHLSELGLGGKSPIAHAVVISTWETLGFEDAGVWHVLTDNAAVGAQGSLRAKFKTWLFQKPPCVGAGLKYCLDD